MGIPATVYEQLLELKCYYNQTLNDAGAASLNCEKRLYNAGATDSFVVFGVFGISLCLAVIAVHCFKKIRTHYYMYRDQQMETLKHPSSFIRAFKERVIHHTKELSDENPIKSLAQKYLYLQQAHSLKDRVYSWIPFVRR